jgi:AcrR family transcriptional regulator
MTKTPWGETDELRSKRLRPGPGQSPELNAANQRERLLAATVAVVAAIGYERMRVADLVEVSGVSRSAFYKHFDNKRDCFLATLDAIGTLAVPGMLASFRTSTGSPDERLAAMLHTLLTTIADQPAATRVFWVEGYAAGPEAVDRIERFDKKVEDIVLETLRASPGRADMPREVVRALCGGLRKLVNTRVREGRERELFDLIPDLLTWAGRYERPAEPLRRPRKPPAGLVELPPPPDDARDRIITAVTDIVADGGYGTMKITEIARRASVSLTTFYEDFNGKGEAFVAAIESATVRTFSAVLPAFQAAPDWPQAVASALHGFFAISAYAPAMAHLAAVGAYEGGRSAMKARDDGMKAFYPFLQPGFEHEPDLPRIVPEAIGASIYAMLTHQVRQRGPDRVYEIAPTAVFIALAPFVGSEEATRLANARPKPPPPSST